MIAETESSSSAQTIFVLISPPLPEIDVIQTLLAPFAPVSESHKRTEDASAPHPPETPTPINIRTTRIPLQPPLNVRQAEEWTKALWPVTYNPAAPRATVAPPAQVLNRARESIQPWAGHYLALAQKVAEEAEQSRSGRGVGAVVVDPAIEIEMDTVNEGEDDRWMQAVVAVAGDARYSRSEGGAPSQAEQHPGVSPNPACQTYNPDLEGGPELHALMRAADMIARRRREEGEPQIPDPAFLLRPLEAYFLYPSSAEGAPSKSNTKANQTEQSSGEKRKRSPSDANSPHPELLGTRIRPRSQGGYLCTDLDIYLTHEPCLCCSMGMLLSRFRAVIFPRHGRMLTGGLASEPVVSPTPSLDAETCTHGHDHRDEKGHEHHHNIPSHDPQQEEEDRIYYGLHWRKELNWRALGFEFVEDGHKREGGEEVGNIQKVAFHA